MVCLVFPDPYLIDETVHNVTSLHHEHDLARLLEILAQLLDGVLMFETDWFQSSLKQGKTI